jgi:hypothetical protein
MDNQINISITDILAIPIVGIILSLIVDYLKIKFQTSSMGDKTITVFLSVVLGVLYYFARDTQVLVNIIGVLAAASTFYAFFLKKPSERDSRF